MNRKGIYFEQLKYSIYGVFFFQDTKKYFHLGKRRLQKEKLKGRYKSNIPHPI